MIHNIFRLISKYISLDFVNDRYVFIKDRLNKQKDLIERKLLTINDLYKLIVDKYITDKTYYKIKTYLNCVYIDIDIKHSSNDMINIIYSGVINADNIKVFRTSISHKDVTANYAITVSGNKISVSLNSGVADYNISVVIDNYVYILDVYMNKPNISNARQYHFENTEDVLFSIKPYSTIGKSTGTISLTQTQTDAITNDYTKGLVSYNKLMYGDGNTSAIRSIGSSASSVTFEKDIYTPFVYNGMQYRGHFYYNDVLENTSYQISSRGRGSDTVNSQIQTLQITSDFISIHGYVCIYNNIVNYLSIGNGGVELLSLLLNTNLSLVSYNLTDMITGLIENKVIQIVVYPSNISEFTQSNIRNDLNDQIELYNINKIDTRINNISLEKTIIDNDQFTLTNGIYTHVNNSDVYYDPFKITLANGYKMINGVDYTIDNGVVVLNSTIDRCVLEYNDRYRNIEYADNDNRILQ